MIALGRVSEETKGLDNLPVSEFPVDIKTRDE
jgi:hypothetical protein